MKTNRLLAIAALLLSVLFLAACGGSGGSHGGGGGSGAKYPTTSLQVAVGGPVQTASLGPQPLVFLGTFADVARVTVAVSGPDKFGVFQNPLATASLTLGGDGVWRGTIADLPVGPTLTFTANGYDGSDVLIFSGVATQALTGSGDALTINMTPQDNGTPVAFPVVNSITRPAEFVVNTSGAVSADVTGSPNETLNYAFNSSGGSFLPASGTIPLPGSGTGTIGTTYTAPAALGTYTQSVRVTNSQGNAVETDFSVTVVSAVTSPGVQVSFAPTVTALLGKRTGNTVTWTATVQDDKDIALLTYAWSFTQTGGTSGAAFSTPAANPGALSGYDQTVAGDVVLSVTDGDGLHTTISFPLVAGQFPDAVVNVPPPSAQPTYTITQIPGLTDDASQPMQINAAGQVLVVGGAYGAYRSYIWNKSAGIGTTLLYGADQTTAAEMNSVGQVVGSNCCGSFQALLWDTDGSATPIGAIFSPSESNFRHINDSGAVTYHNLVGGIYHAYYRSPDGTVSDIGQPADSYTYAFDLNNAGQVTGISAPSGGIADAYVWTAASGMVRLNVPGQAGWQTRINEAGQVAGIIQTPTREDRIFVWSPATGLRDLGIPAPGALYASVVAINAAGQILAVSYDMTIYNNVAHVFNPDGSVVAIPSLGGTGVSGSAINNRGQVVGWATDGAENYRAFVWSPATGTIALDDGGLGGSSGWARDINDNGQIVGMTLLPGRWVGLEWDEAIAP